MTGHAAQELPGRCSRVAGWQDGNAAMLTRCAGAPATGSLSKKKNDLPKCQPDVHGTLRLRTTGGGGGPAAAGPFFLDSSASLFTSTSFSYLQHVQQSVPVGGGAACQAASVASWCIARCSSTERPPIVSLECSSLNAEAAML